MFSKPKYWNENYEYVTFQMNLLNITWIEIRINLITLVSILWMTLNAHLTKFVFASFWFSATISCQNWFLTENSYSTESKASFSILAKKLKLQKKCRKSETGKSSHSKEEKKVTLYGEIFKKNRERLFCIRFELQ